MKRRTPQFISTDGCHINVACIACIVEDHTRVTEDNLVLKGTLVELVGGSKVFLTKNTASEREFWHKFNCLHVPVTGEEAGR